MITERLDYFLNARHIFSVLLITSNVATLLLYLMLGFQNTCDLFFDIYRNICHQLPERSFILAQKQLVLCARCSGVFMGFYTGLLTVFFSNKWHITSIKSFFIFSAIAPLIIDGTTQYLGLRNSTNELRFATGLLAGTVPTLCLLCIINGIAGKKEISFREYVDRKALTIYIATFLLFTIFFQLNVYTFSNSTIVYYLINYQIIASFIFYNMAFWGVLALLIYFHFYLRHKIPKTALE